MSIVLSTPLPTFSLPLPTFSFSTETMLAVTSIAVTSLLAAIVYSLIPSFIDVRPPLSAKDMVDNLLEQGWEGALDEIDMGLMIEGLYKAYPHMTMAEERSIRRFFLDKSKPLEPKPVLVKPLEVKPLESKLAEFKPLEAAPLSSKEVEEALFTPSPRMPSNPQTPQAANTPSSSRATSPNHQTLDKNILFILSEHPQGSTSREILTDLRGGYPDLGKTDVNSRLYSLLKDKAVTKSIPSTGSGYSTSPLWKVAP